MLTDVSSKQDESLCIFNFLPSVDNFWVFGNTIYKDYYVYHNPNEAYMKWVPTSARRKEYLKKGNVPTASMEYGYDNSYFLRKLFLVLIACAGTGATAHYIFTTTFTGVSILNQASRKKKEKLIVKV